MTRAGAGLRYVLMTAAYNEERHIGGTIESVVSQTSPPERWVIVSDASSDRTDEIVLEAARTSPFIRLHRITEPHARNFACQVKALNHAYRMMADLDFDAVGNLDADITFDPGYFRALLRRFEERADLGIGGGFIHEMSAGEFRSREMNSVRSVPHAVQLFRRVCYEEMAGYLALEFGGPDWVAEVKARMRGWSVESFPDLVVRHHRRTGTAGNLVRHMYRQGFMDHALGSYPPFEILKCIRRLPGHPLGASARLLGFAVATARAGTRPVDREFVEFLRAEQRQRIRDGLGRALRMRR